MTLLMHETQLDSTTWIFKIKTNNFQKFLFNAPPIEHTIGNDAKRSHTAVLLSIYLKNDWPINWSSTSFYKRSYSTTAIRIFQPSSTFHWTNTTYQKSTYKYRHRHTHIGWTCLSTFSRPPILFLFFFSLFHFLVIRGILLYKLTHTCTYHVVICAPLSGNP